MKQSLPMPVTAGIVVVLVLIIGFFVWRSFFAPPSLPPEAMNTAPPPNPSALSNQAPRDSYNAMRAGAKPSTGQ